MILEVLVGGILGSVALSFATVVICHYALKWEREKALLASFEALIVGIMLSIIIVNVIAQVGAS